MKRLSFALSLLAVSGCTLQEIEATDPHDVVKVSAASVNGPFVQAGTGFRVTMDRPVGTQLSQPGDEFSATMEDSIVDSAGHVLVTKGAKLYGHVADIDRGTIPHIKLTFTGIDMQNGQRVPVEARIVEARRVTYPGEPLYGGYADPYAVGDPWLDYNSVFTYPAYSRFEYSREIQIPMGAQMTLQLTRPMLSPGSSLKTPAPR